MANNLIAMPIEYFPDPEKGRPLFNAKIYVGNADVNPRIPENQKQVVGRQEDGTEVNLPQPIRTSAGGIPTHAGSPVTILVDGAYSLAVDDRNDAQQYYFENTANGAPLTTINGVMSVANIAALRALDPSIANQQIELLEYSANGLGGGKWRYDAADTTSADNAFNVLVTPNGARWKKIEIPSVTFEEFGYLQSMTDAQKTTVMQTCIDFLADREGGEIRAFGVDYSFNSIQLRAGVTIRGVGTYATRLLGNIIVSSGSYTDRNGVITGNNSGQYHTGLENLTVRGDGTGIGVHLREGWWARLNRLNIENFDIGYHLGIGTSIVTGCYWTVFDQVWSKDNNRGCVITDFTNLCVWNACRFSNNANWDVDIVEPSSNLLLGMQGNRFVDCEFASTNQVRLAATIWSMTFTNPYFEGTGVAVLDDSTHSKRSLVFTDAKVFGANSTVSKIRSGLMGQCTDWIFNSITTNLSRGAGVTDPLYVIEMGANAFWFSINGIRTINSVGFNLYSPAQTTRDKWKLLDTRNGSVQYFAKLVSSDETLLSNARVSANAEIDEGLTSVKANSLETVFNIDGFAATNIMRIKRGAIANAFSATSIQITLAARDVDNTALADWFYIGMIRGNTTQVSIREIINSKGGAGAFTPIIQAAIDGDDILVTISDSSSLVVNQTSITVKASCAGNFVGFLERP